MCDPVLEQSHGQGMSPATSIGNVVRDYTNDVGHVLRGTDVPCFVRGSLPGGSSILTENTYSEFTGSALVMTKPMG